jgi:hypothetical protein
VVDISRTGELEARTWWMPEEIHKIWPDLFDATSGHLPVPLLARIAEAFRGYLGELPAKRYDVPTGSGETITCLRIAYPRVRFTAVYNLNAATLYDDRAPMDTLVEAMGVRVFGGYRG